MRLSRTIVIVTAMLAAMPSYADSARQIDKDTITEQQQSLGTFRTLPTNHVSPTRNSWMLALDFSQIATQAKTGTSDDSLNHGEKLNLSGQTYAPFLAYSGKSFGAGISPEFGSLASVYNRSSDGYEEESRLKYSGMGGLVFFNPFASSGFFTLTLVAGMKQLNVSHRVRSHNGEASTATADTWEKRSYTITRGYTGSHVELQFTDNVALIPWANYAWTSTADFEEALEDKPVQHRERFAGDGLVYWQGREPLNYGIDLAVRLGFVKLHVGNLIGAAVNRSIESRTSTQVKDQSFNIGITFTTR